VISTLTDAELSALSVCVFIVRDLPGSTNSEKLDNMLSWPSVPFASIGDESPIVRVKRSVRRHVQQAGPSWYFAYAKEAVTNYASDHKSIVGVGTVAIVACIFAALIYVKSKRDRKEARGFFRQIPVNIVKDHCVPVLTRNASSPTGMCDVMVKYRFESGTYWGLTKHVFDNGFDPYVKIKVGDVEKTVQLTPLVQFTGKDQAYIPAEKLAIPYVKSLKVIKPSRSGPMALLSFDPDTGNPVIAQSLYSLDSNRLHYDCDTYNYQCGSVAICSETLCALAMHTGTYGSGNGNYGDVLIDPSTKSQEPSRARVITTPSMKSGSKSATSGQNRKEKARVAEEEKSLNTQQHMQKVAKLKQKFERAERLKDDYAKRIPKANEEDLSDELMAHVDRSYKDFQDYVISNKLDIDAYEEILDTASSVLDKRDIYIQMARSGEDARDIASVFEKILKDLYEKGSGDFSSLDTLRDRITKRRSESAECVHVATCPKQLPTNASTVCNVACSGHNCTHFVGCKPPKIIDPPCWHANECGVSSSADGPCHIACVNPLCFHMPKCVRPPSYESVLPQIPLNANAGVVTSHTAPMRVQQNARDNSGDMVSTVLPVPSQMISKKTPALVSQTPLPSSQKKEVSKSPSNNTQPPKQPHPQSSTPLKPLEEKSPKVSKKKQRGKKQKN
jgi:hypothetical protein